MQPLHAAINNGLDLKFYANFLGLAFSNIIPDNQLRQPEQTHLIQRHVCHILRPKVSSL